MRRTTSIACAVAVALAASNTFAITPASQSTKGTGYLVLAEDLSNWHLAAYGSTGTRTVEDDNDFEMELKVKRYAAILGYDVTRWMTIYGLAGVMEADRKYGMGNGQDTSLLIGAGTWLNLLQSEELTLLSTVSYYKLTAGAEVSYADLDDYSWGQLDGYLTFGIVNELENNTMIFPETIGIFAGPIVSYLMSDELDADTDNTVGMTVGVTMTFSTSTYATISYDIFSDDDTLAGMVGVRF